MSKNMRAWPLHCLENPRWITPAIPHGVRGGAMSSIVTPRSTRELASKPQIPQTPAPLAASNPRQLGCARSGAFFGPGLAGVQRAAMAFDWKKAEQWRQHPLLTNNQRVMLPGFGIGLAAFAVYVAFDKLTGGKKAGHH